MYSEITFRTGNEKALVSEFLKLYKSNSLNFEVANLEPYDLWVDNVLAVHYADRGAQGDAGAVEILYLSWEGVKVLYGNFVYGKLDLDKVIQKLPILEHTFSCRSFAPRYPVEEEIDNNDWGYFYMGAMNHFFARKIICDKTEKFIDTLLKNGGYSWHVFDAVAWVCMAQQSS